MTSNHLRLPAQLAAARRRFEHWRSTRRAPCRIPPHLWKAAEHCAAKYGVFQTVRALGLDYKALKKRVVSTAGAPAAPGRAPTFVELVAPERNGQVGCIVEVENPRGARLRIELRGAGIQDLAEFARRFAAEGE